MSLEESEKSDLIFEETGNKDPTHMATELATTKCCAIH